MIRGKVVVSIMIEMIDMVENGMKREVVMIRGKVAVRNMIEMIDMVENGMK